MNTFPQRSRRIEELERAITDFPEDAHQGTEAGGLLLYVREMMSLDPDLTLAVLLNKLDGINKRERGHWVDNFFLRQVLIEALCLTAEASPCRGEALRHLAKIGATQVSEDMRETIVRILATIGSQDALKDILGTPCQNNPLLFNAIAKCGGEVAIRELIRKLGPISIQHFAVSDAVAENEAASAALASMGNIVIPQLVELLRTTKFIEVAECACKILLGLSWQPSEVELCVLVHLIYEHSPMTVAAFGVEGLRHGCHVQDRLDNSPARLALGNKKYEPYAGRLIRKLDSIKETLNEAIVEYLKNPNEAEIVSLLTGNNPPQIKYAVIQHLAENGSERLLETVLAFTLSQQGNHFQYCERPLCQRHWEKAKSIILAKLNGVGLHPWIRRDSKRRFDMHMALSCLRSARILAEIEPEIGVSYLPRLAIALIEGGFDMAETRNYEFSSCPRIPFDEIESATGVKVAVLKLAYDSLRVFHMKRYSDGSWGIDETISRRAVQDLCAQENPFSSAVLALISMKNDEGHGGYGGPYSGDSYDSPQIIKFGDERQMATNELRRRNVDVESHGEALEKWWRTDCLPRLVSWQRQQTLATVVSSPQQKG